VTCIDKDAAKIGQLRRGMIPIFELGLEALVASNVEAGRLSFTIESAAIRSADAVFLAVGTPSRRRGTVLPPLLCLRRGVRDRGRNAGRYCRRHQVDGADRNQ
jgi:UDP-glucose 6-dehydrogenase